MPTKAVQVKFTGGQVDTSVSSRIDQKAYYEGLEQAENVRIGIQGTAIRRPGTKHIAKLSENPTAAGAVKLIEFEPNSNEAFLIIVSVGDLTIYKYNKATRELELDNSNIVIEYEFLDSSKVVDSSISGIDIPSSSIATSQLFSATSISVCKTAQQNNTLWFFNPYFPICTLVYDDSDEFQPLFKLGVVTFKNEPFYRFGTNTEVKPINTFLTFESKTGDLVKVTASEENTFIDPTKTTEVNNVDIPNSPTRNSNLSVGDYLVSAYSGRARIIEYVSDQEVKVRIETKITFKSEIENSNAATPPPLILDAGDWHGLNGYEPSWSAKRGYPTCGGFHQGRLWVMGTAYQGDFIWGSKVTSTIPEYTNMAYFEDRADTGITAPLATKRPVQIRAMESKNSLQIFTNIAEYYIPSDVGTPITNTNMTARQATAHGISDKLDTLQAGNTTLFVEDNGKVVRQFTYNDDLQTFDAPNISVLSSDLIKNPVNAAYQTSTPRVQSHFVYLVNEEGDMAVCNYADDEKKYPWTRWTTKGEFRDVASFDDTLITVVSRDNGTFLEQFDENCLLDNCKKSSVENTTTSDWATAADHLVGMDRSDIKVLANKYIDDGAVFSTTGSPPNETLTTGSVTTTNKVSEVEVGLDFRAAITTLPIEIVVNESQAIGDRKALISVNVGLLESQAVTLEVDGKTYKPSVRHFGANFFNKTVEDLIVKTGYQEQFVSGIVRDAKIKITQDQPVQFGIKYLGVVIQSGKDVTN